MEPQQVDIPGVGLVEFPESMTPEAINAAAAKLYQEHQPKPQGQVRSRTGQMYTPPATGEGPLEHFGQRLVSNLNPINIAKNVGGLLYNAVTDPAKAGQQVVEGIAEPFREVGRGEFPEAAADAATALLAARAPGSSAPEMAGGVPVSELRAAGVGDQSIRLMQQGRPSNVVQMPRGTVRVPPTQGNLAVDDLVQRPTTRVQMGDLVQRPTDTVRAQPLATPDALAAPPSAPTPPATPKMKLDAVQVARMMRDQFGAEEGARKLYGPVQKGADSDLNSAAQRTAILKDLASKSTLPDTARAGIDQALARMSPDEAQAYFAKGNPVAQKYMQFAHRDLFGDERGSIPIDLLHLLSGGTAIGAGYRIANAALPYVPAVVKSPAFQGAVRAAVLASLAARGAPDSDASLQSGQGAR